MAIITPDVTDGDGVTVELGSTRDYSAVRYINYFT